MGAARTHFAEEISTFEKLRPQWLASGLEGRWVAVRGARCCGPFSTSDEAWSAGCEQLDGPGFLLRRVAREERPAVVSHIFFEAPDGPE